MHFTEDSLNFKTRDAASYDSLTGEFERFTQRFTQPLAERLVELAALRPSDRLLDVGTGTGVIALAAAAQTSFRGTIIAVDLSGGMLTAAQSKVLDQGLASRVAFARMDAEQLALQNASFDTVISLFALLHFPNPLSALREMFRVLRPGGRLVIAVGSGPPLFSWTAVAEGMKVLGRVLRVRTKKLLIAPRALDDLVMRRIAGGRQPEESWLARQGHKRAQRVPELIREAGFLPLETRWYGAESVVEEPEEFWQIQRTFSSVARKRLLDATPEIIEALHKEFLGTCRDIQSRGGKLVYPFAALCLLAQRPFNSPRI